MPNLFSIENGQVNYDFWVDEEEVEPKVDMPEYIYVEVEECEDEAYK